MISDAKTVPEAQVLDGESFMTENDSAEVVSLQQCSVPNEPSHQSYVVQSQIQPNNVQVQYTSVQAQPVSIPQENPVHAQPISIQQQPVYIQQQENPVQAQPISIQQQPVYIQQQTNPIQEQPIYIQQQIPKVHVVPQRQKENEPTEPPPTQEIICCKVPDVDYSKWFILLVVIPVIPCLIIYFGYMTDKDCGSYFNERYLYSMGGIGAVAVLTYGCFVLQPKKSKTDGYSISMQCCLCLAMLQAVGAWTAIVNMAIWYNNGTCFDDIIVVMNPTPYPSSPPSAFSNVYPTYSPTSVVQPTSEDLQNVVTIQSTNYDGNGFSYISLESITIRDWFDVEMEFSDIAEVIEEYTPFPLKGCFESYNHCETNHHGALKFRLKRDVFYSIELSYKQDSNTLDSFNNIECYYEDQLLTQMKYRPTKSSSYKFILG